MEKEGGGYMDQIKAPGKGQGPITENESCCTEIPVTKTKFQRGRGRGWGRIKSPVMIRLMVGRPVHGNPRDALGAA